MNKPQRVNPVLRLDLLPAGDPRLSRDVVRSDRAVDLTHELPGNVAEMEARYPLPAIGSTLTLPFGRTAVVRKAYWVHTLCHSTMNVDVILPDGTPDLVQPVRGALRR